VVCCSYETTVDGEAPALVGETLFHYLLTTVMLREFFTFVTETILALNVKSTFLVAKRIKLSH